MDSLKNYHGEAQLPLAFNSSTTASAPVMLAASRADRHAQWDLKAQPPTAVSSPGEDLPPFPSLMHDLNRIQTLPEDAPLQQITDRRVPPPPLNLKAGPSPFSAVAGMGGVGMEKQASSSGMVAGIEWVDWYDCYKRYKGAKIHAEAEAAKERPQTNSSPGESDKPVPPVVSDNRRSVLREIDLGSACDSSSVVALTPTTSRDEDAGSQSRVRKRSMSIRSTLSSMEPKLSPTLKRTSVFERPRQSSGSSSRSIDVSSSTGNKKKNNLVNKMEGWWNAVKSNFVPEGPHHSRRPSNLGTHVQHRAPSLPQGQRGSDMSPTTTPQAALLAPQPIRRDSSHSLSQAASHADLRSHGQQYDAQSLQEAASIVGSTSADLAPLKRGFDAHSMAPPAQVPARAPSIDLEETLRPFSQQQGVLEARRGPYPNLRLDLESTVMTRPGSHMTSSSGSAGRGSHHSDLGRLPNSLPTETSSRSSSYGQPFHGPGLTPGVPKWDQTPSPIFALAVQSRSAKEDKPVAPGAEITVASVRRHVRHRLNAAKEACDNTLKKAIAAITKFAEEQNVADEDDTPVDYFAAMSDSPVIDLEESENETGDKVEDGMRSGAGSCSV